MRCWVRNFSRSLSTSILGFFLFRAWLVGQGFNPDCRNCHKNHGLYRLRKTQHRRCAAIPAQAIGLGPGIDEISEGGRPDGSLFPQPV
jgi:hypothetical protein